MSLRVMHSIPGRLRLQGNGFRNSIAVLHRLEEGLQSVEGVDAVRTTPVTGSVLILYDADSVREEILRQKVQEISGLSIRGIEKPDSERPTPLREGEVTPMALAIQEPFFQLNTGIFRSTGGYMDLRHLLPLGLVVYGTLKLLRQGPIPAIPWYVLYWWSFRTFMIFNRPAK